MASAESSVTISTSNLFTYLKQQCDRSKYFRYDNPYIVILKHASIVVSKNAYKSYVLKMANMWTDDANLGR